MKMPDPSGKSLDDNSIIKRRDLLYRLMISQLFYDGYQQVALALNNMISPDPPCPPSDRLFNIVSEGLKFEKDIQPKKQDSENYIETLVGPGLDLEYDTDIQSAAPEPALYTTAYVTSHKAPCRACAFSPDGQLVATGSIDSSIKVLDVDRMVAKATDDRRQEPQSMKESYETHPVIRTLYDHTDEVTCLEFHPKEAILLSGSRDRTVKIFDYSKSSVKKAFKIIQDAEPVRCMSIHPTGDYVVVGTRHNVIRLYDLNTAQCYVCNFPSHQHNDSITSIKYTRDGKLYCSGSRDGSVKIWDGVSNRCVNTFFKAHDGSEVCSVEFTRNGKYILTSGKDSLVKLWELTTGRCLIAYTGAGATGRQMHRAHAVFNHTEDYVIFADEASKSLCVWNARNASRRQLLALGHNNAVRYIAHSPTKPAFMSCSDDHRARFWQRWK